MNEFWIDFCGYLKVKADSEEEAREKFWNSIHNIVDKDDETTFEIQGIEEA